eukprot:TRINITY_DN613_c0_g1_i5.p2 TRINITY_DN613_c0_g1~~TRINITY_DN613_c0_g1_i5.p2  ORF type:complete len:113 (-),score=11.69 TRINITY_DN613_c0_g1_i5:11-349(-)
MCIRDRIQSSFHFFHYNSKIGRYCTCLLQQAHITQLPFEQWFYLCPLLSHINKTPWSVLQDGTVVHFARYSKVLINFFQSLKLTYHSLSTSCLLYTSPSPRDLSTSRMPSSA